MCLATEAHAATWFTAVSGSSKHTVLMCSRKEDAVAASVAAEVEATADMVAATASGSDAVSDGGSEGCIPDHNPCNYARAMHWLTRVEQRIVKGKAAR